MTGVRGLRSISRLSRAAEATMVVFLAGVLPAAAQRNDQRPLSITELERRAAVDSNDPAIQIQLGRALLERGRHDDAHGHFRTAAVIAPGLAEAYLGLAAIPPARGETYWKRLEKRDGREPVIAAWTEAVKFSRLAFLLDPLVEPGLIPRVEERVTVRVDGVNYVVWWRLPLAKAVNAFRATKYQDAKRRCEKLLEDSAAGSEGTGVPDDVLWFHALAAAHLGDYQVAATGFTRLMTRAVREAQFAPLESSPLRANDYRYMAATMLYFAGQLEVASLLFREALGLDPSLYMAHSRLARIHEHSRRWDEAVLERQRAVDVNPENSDLLVHLGWTLSKANRPEPAYDAFERASVMNPRDPEAPYHAGLTALELGRKEIARASLVRFLALAPGRMASEAADARRHLEALGR